MAGLFAVQFAVGAAVGFAIGHFAVWSLNRLNIDNASLYPILLLSVAFFTFSATGLLHGNGYLAVYLTGMIIGNNRIPYRKEVATFMDGLTWLFQIIMFLMLGLLVNPHEMFRVACVALLIGLFMICTPGQPVSSFAFCPSGGSMLAPGSSSRGWGYAARRPSFSPSTP